MLPEKSIFTGANAVLLSLSENRKVYYHVQFLTNAVLLSLAENRKVYYHVQFLANAVLLSLSENRKSIMYNF